MGQLGTLALATYSVAYSIEPVVFMLPIGLSTSLSNSVGNKLGAREPAQAKRLAVTGVACGFIVVLLYAAVVWLCGDAIASLFSTDAEVLAHTRLMWPWFCPFLLVSGMFALMLGLTRGLGLQRATAIFVVSILWPVGAPLVLFWAQTPSNVWQSLTLTCAHHRSHHRSRTTVYCSHPSPPVCPFAWLLAHVSSLAHPYVPCDRYGSCVSSAQTYSSRAAWRSAQPALIGRSSPSKPTRPAAGTRPTRQRKARLPARSYPPLPGARAAELEQEAWPPQTRRRQEQPTHDHAAVEVSAP